MNAVTTTAESLRNSILNPTNGIVGLVDDLLRTCAENRVDLSWSANRCRVRSEGTWEEIDVRTKRPILRAILARLAALSNVREPGSMSPYGGQGELMAGEPPIKLQFSFANTTAEQRLEILTERNL